MFLNFTKFRDEKRNFLKFNVCIFRDKQYITNIRKLRIKFYYLLFILLFNFFPIFLFERIIKKNPFKNYVS